MSKYTSLQVLQFISSFINANGYSPTIREIMTGNSMRSTGTASHHVNKLSKLGDIVFVPDRARTISITPQGADRLVI